jgi:hypothetical protein
VNVDNILDISIPDRRISFSTTNISWYEISHLKNSTAFSLETKTERYLLHLYVKFFVLMELKNIQDTFLKYTLHVDTGMHIKYLVVFIAIHSNTCS